MKPETLITSPAKQALWDAADYIEKHGHCRGAAFGEDGSACVIGAMPRNMERLGMELLRQNGIEAIVFWSDHTPTAEVIDTLRSVALS